MHPSLHLLLVCAAFAGSLAAQKGDRSGETQADLPRDLVVPPAPVRTPAEELLSFQLAPGLMVELVASEPLIGDPVQAVFDERGRLWVVEMRGFMPDVDATGEAAPVGRIVVLSDHDGDGQMDDSIVFQDGLVLPRALGLVAGGVLVIEPPHLWFFPDADGDLRPEGRKLLASGFDAGIHNPEHAANGLVRGIDNWIECANWGVRLRWDHGTAVREATFSGGQWGVCFDDFGRRYYDYNSDFLRTDLVPGRYGVRWPVVPAAPLWNQQVVKDQSTWPIRPTPGVNRGYQKNQLRSDFTLKTCTAACAPFVDRGGALPKPYAGSAFVCEPAGNLVARFELGEDGILVRGQDSTPGKPFFASTDERFRPVNLTQGPDGALYVVDMYRGVIQHKNFVTTFLRKQIVARGLERPIGHGRIWRITAAGAAKPARFDLAKEDNQALVARLASQNGFVRDQAQRLLVERGARDVRDALTAALAGAPDPRVRLHALWTLAGLACATPLVIERAIADASDFVRAAGVRLLEESLAGSDPRPSLRVLERTLSDAAPRVRVQAALTLGSLPVSSGARLLAFMALEHGDDFGMPTAIATGASGRASEVLLAIEEGASDLRGKRALATVELLARAVALAKDKAQVVACLRVGAKSRSSEINAAIRAGMERALPKTADDSIGILASEDSLELAGLLAKEHPRLAAALTRKATPDAKFSPLHERRRRDGGMLFAQNCSACHQQDGRGLAGLAPSLHDAPLLLAPADRAVRIGMHGLAGPLQVNGESWNLAMPGHPSFDDDQIAAVVTFVRGEFGRREEHTTADDVRRIRESHRTRNTAWSAEELEGK